VAIGAVIDDAGETEDKEFAGPWDVFYEYLRVQNAKTATMRGTKDGRTDHVLVDDGTLSFFLSI
jgi:hypothetical protein